MNDRHKRAGLFALVGLLLAGIALPRASQAQDHPYLEFILGYLESEFAITGGDFVLSTDVDSLLDSPGQYGLDFLERQGPDPEFGFDYLHMESTQATNAWDGGINWRNRTAVAEGETGLAVALIRGETVGGEGGVVNVLFERASDPYDKSLDRGSFQLTADWTLIAIPFSFHDSFAPNTAQYAYHLTAVSQSVEMTAPVVLNFHNRYTPEVLQGMIDSGGQVPTLANISQDVVRGVPPFTVNFDASNSSSPVEIVSYSWNFGDGNTATGVTTSHEYTAEGIYDVVLTIVDANNVTHRDTSRVVGFNGIGLPESPLDIPYTADAPTIDGTVDGVWSGATTVNMTFHVNDNPPQDAADISGTASVLWDAENLYVLYRITDQTKINDTPETSWQDDSVDLYIDGRNERGTSYDANDVQYTFRWGDPDNVVTGNGVDNGRAEGVEYRWADTDNGYIVEAKVPWANVSTLPVTDTRIGIEFMVNDADLSGPVRDTKLAWYGLEDFAYTNPSLMGTGRLTGGEGQVIAPVFSWTPTSGMAGVPITFDASESVAPGTITSYEWNFGDGNSGSGATVEHTFEEGGAYQVSLTITDDQGNTQTRTRTVNVGAGALQIPRTAEVPVIDGIMEDAWNTYAVSVTLEINNNGSPPDGPDDLSATAYAMWDMTHIYVFFDVTDDVLVTGDSPSALYQDDQVEFFLDADNSKTQDAHDENDAQFAMNYGLETLSGDAASKYPNTVFTSVATENGWALEAAIPWGDVNVTPYRGMLIGIDFQVNDDDDGGDRDSKISWYETTDNGWQYAHVFGTGVLMDPFGVDVEDAAELPEQFAIESVYPNPFNPSTTALVSIREVGAYQLSIYNVLGQLIEERSIEVQMPGRVELNIDLSSRASGLYLISLKHKTSGKTVTSRATLLK